MAKFRKKPVVIEAVQFLADDIGKVLRFLTMDGSWPVLAHDERGYLVIKIPTLEGEVTADLGDWIIKGVAGEFYPCKPSIFEATYEPVEEDNAVVCE